MNERAPGSPPVPNRHEPPPVPRAHEPPAIPTSFALETKASTKPEPVTSLSRKNDDVSFELEGSPAIESRAPAVRKLHEPPDVPVELELEPAGGELDPTGKASFARKSSFLAWLALSLALLCIPPSIVAALFFVVGLGLWPLVLICSLLAVSFGRYAKERGGPSANLAGLAVQLGRGFFAIGLVGLATIGLSAAIYGIATIQSLNERWRESNAIMRWGTEQVEAVKGLFSSQKPNDPAAPSPSPAPTSSR